MGRNIKTLFIVITIAVFNFQFPQVYADTPCQPIYGGGQTCVTVGTIVIDKKVLNPQTNAFVDNLNINHPKYQPGFIVSFKLDITNAGSAVVPRTKVKDIFPQYIDFSAGPGSFNPTNKVLTFTIDNLNPNETRTFTIVGRVVNASKLPTNQSVVCVVNQVTATTAKGGMSQSNSQLCIEKKVVPTPVTKRGFPVLSPVPVYTTPSTGAQALILFSLIPIGISGWLLRKHA